MIEIQRHCWGRMKQNHFDLLVITSSGSWRSHCEILKNIILELELFLIWGYNVFYILKKWQIKRKLKEALDESIKLRNIAMQLKNSLSTPLKCLLRVAVMKKKHVHLNSTLFPEKHKRRSKSRSKCAISPKTIEEGLPFSSCRTCFCFWSIIICPAPFILFTNFSSCPLISFFFWNKLFQIWTLCSSSFTWNKKYLTL